MLDKVDLHFIVTRLPAKLRKLLKSDSMLFVAGGFIRACIAGEQPSDIDVFCDSRENAERSARKLANELSCSLIETDNAYTVRSPLPVQFIHRWTFNHPSACIESFDFTIAKAAVWYQEGAWCSLADSRFYPDLAAKRLTYTSPVRNEEAGGSLLRVLRFYQRGYRIPLPSLAATIARLCNSVRDINFLPEERLATVLCGLLREVDPLTDPDHILDEDDQLC